MLAVLALRFTYSLFITSRLHTTRDCFVYDTNCSAFHSTYTHSYCPKYIRKLSLLVITYIFNSKYALHIKLWLLNWSKNQDNHTLVGLAMILPSGLPLIAQSISIYCLSFQWFLSHFLMSLLRYFIFLLYNM